MKKNPLTLLTGIVVAAIFAAMLFCFQVRQTEVAVVTTFGKASPASLEQPRLYWRWPWPIQNVHRFDKRIRNFEKRYEQTTTRDGRIILVEVFVGWSVKDPRVFLERLGGDASAAEQKLEGLLRDAKNSVVGQHPLGDFISTNEKDLKFDLIEKEMLTAIQAKAADASYGLEISLLGIKQLGLPESITTKVFDRMKAEREQLAAQFKGEAAAEDLRIRSEANRQRDSLLADAERQATIIKGQADAAVADQLKTFETNPELAVFLLKLNAVESSLKERSTLVLDPRTPPFDLLRGQPELPETKKPSNR